MSDIHCHEKSDKPQGGYYFPSMSDTPINKNPFASVKELIRDYGIEVDYLLCPGDYAHQMDIKGLKSSWEQLKLVGNELNAKLLIGTIGNHDVASRTPTGDSFKEVKEFDRDFPVYRTSASKEYLNALLNDAFYTIDDENLDLLFVILNSCYDHWTAVEASRGKFPSDHLKKIKEIIDSSVRKRKVLMVHHHPIVHETGISDTGDLIEGSEDLLRATSTVDLIIHGHKHDFRFTQHQTFPKNLNVLASGSFSCFKTSMKTTGQNTFHIVEFHLQSEEKCVNQGIVKTYLYDPSEGWYIDEDLQEGFGCTLSQHELNEFLLEQIRLRKDDYVLWEELVEEKATLKYITRHSRNKALQDLKSRGEIKRFKIDRFGNLQGDIIIR